MKRFIVLSISVLGVVGLSTGVASAGKPVVHACHGETNAALATTQPFPGAFGAGVRSFAQDPDSKPGLGDGIQLLHAGLVPDDVVPNTCND